MSSEMMHPDEWLAAAQSCDVGHKKKVRHLCGDASLVVYNNVDSWTAWCWRCGTPGWVPKAEANMKERLARAAKRKELDDAISYTTVAPYPKEFDVSAWSPAARLWLYKAGLPVKHIKALGAYYHEPTGRVVLPITDGNGSLVFWQSRNCEYPQGGAKYISSSVPRDRVHVLFPRAGRTGSFTVVITEDILSAYKCGVAGALGYAVMGTKLGAHSLAYFTGLAASGDVRFALWFDPDDAGRSADSSLRRQLRLVGIEPSSIVTPKDPKQYSFEEIRGFISGSHAATNHAGSETILPTAPDAQPEVG